MVGRVCKTHVTVDQLDLGAGTHFAYFIFKLAGRGTAPQIQNPPAPAVRYDVLAARSRIAPAIDNIPSPARRRRCRSADGPQSDPNAVALDNERLAITRGIKTLERLFVRR